MEKIKLNFIDRNLGTMFTVFWGVINVAACITCIKYGETKGSIEYHNKLVDKANTILENGAEQI